MEQLSELDSSVIDDESFRWYSLINAFGADGTHKQAYSNAHGETKACLTNGLPKVLGTTLFAIEENVPNMISFSKSIVDQPSWERISSVPTNPTAGDDSAASPSLEISLFLLIQNFVAHITTTSIMGFDFHDHYPWFLDDIWDLDNGFKYLLLGFPRWLPIQSLTKAHLARQRLKSEINEFHRALQVTKDEREPAYPLTAMGGVSAVMKDRSEVWREHGSTADVQVSRDLDLLWKSVSRFLGPRSWQLMCTQYEYKNRQTRILASPPHLLNPGSCREDPKRNITLRSSLSSATTLHGRGAPTAED